MGRYFFLGILIACGSNDNDKPIDTHDTSDTTDTSDTGDTGDTGDTYEDLPIECIGLENYRGYLAELDTPNERTQLADFPLSVPNLIDLGGTIWLAAQMFEGYERHCDVIGFADLEELPSSDIHPLSPVRIQDLPELGQIPNRSDLIFPPADPTLVYLPDSQETVLITTLRLADAPDEPCIGLSLAEDGLDTTAGFHFLENSLWCEPGIAMMDAAGFYDETSSVLHIVFADFAEPDVANYHATILTDRPADQWSPQNPKRLTFDDFHLLGNFSDGDSLCSGPTFFGTRNQNGDRDAVAACFEPEFADFETVVDFEIKEIGDPSVVFSAQLDQTLLVYSKQR